MILVNTKSRNQKCFFFFFFFFFFSIFLIELEIYYQDRFQKQFTKDFYLFYLSILFYFILFYLFILFFYSIYLFFIFFN